MAVTLSGENVSLLLQSMREGDKQAEQQLMDALYGELHAIAVTRMRRERSDHTLQPTALVNEVYLRLVVPGRCDWKDRIHFFACACRVMHHVLTDHAKQRLAAKRGGGIKPVNAETAIIAEDRLTDVLVLNDLLTKLEAAHPAVAQVVLCRLFGGLSVEEIAELMNISPRTVKRHWSYGRAWLKSRLTPDEPDVAG